MELSLVEQSFYPPRGAAPSARAWLAQAVVLSCPALLLEKAQAVQKLRFVLLNLPLQLAGDGEKYEASSTDAEQLGCLNCAFAGQRPAGWLFRAAYRM